MAESAAVAAATTAAQTIQSNAQNVRDIEGNSQLFEETAKRVQQTFFSKQYTNACAEEQNVKI